MNGLGMRHLIRIAPINLQNLIAHLQPPVQLRGAHLRQLEHKQRYIELLATAYTEPEAALHLPAQLNHVVLILVNDSPSVDFIKLS